MEPPFISECDGCGRLRPLTVYPLCSLCAECITDIGLTVIPNRESERG